MYAIQMSIDLQETNFINIIIIVTWRPNSYTGRHS